MLMIDFLRVHESASSTQTESSPIWAEAWLSNGLSKP